MDGEKNKGRHQTEATKQKIREAHLGKHASIETRKKMSEMHSGEKNGFYGKKHTDETRKKMRENHADFHKEKHPRWGVHLSEETKRKIGDANSGENSHWFGIKDERNPGWKGNNISYTHVHRWIREKKHKPVLCELCDADEPKEIANISGEYMRDVNDYLWVCCSCHKIYDSIVNNFKREKGAMRTCLC